MKIYKRFYIGSFWIELSKGNYLQAIKFDFGFGFYGSKYYRFKKRIRKLRNERNRQTK